MSVSSSIDLKIKQYNKECVSANYIILQLLNYGWTLNDNSNVSYLPLGDDDDFNWQREDISKEALLKIICEKEQKGELIGVVMTWEETDVGGEFIIRSDGSISISLTLNRKLLDLDFQGSMTDLNWYFTRLLPALSKEDLQVESFAFEEYV